MAKIAPLQIKGYTVFILKCADGSYFSGMCRDLEKRVKDLNSDRFGFYFSKYPERIPVTVAFREDHIPFDEAFAKHRYLRSLTRRYRDKMIENAKWPLGKQLRDFLKKKQRYSK